MFNYFEGIALWDYNSKTTFLKGLKPVVLYSYKVEVLGLVVRIMTECM